MKCEINHTVGAADQPRYAVISISIQNVLEASLLILLINTLWDLIIYSLRHEFNGEITYLFIGLICECNLYSTSFIFFCFYVNVNIFIFYSCNRYIDEFDEIATDEVSAL